MTDGVPTVDAMTPPRRRPTRPGAPTALTQDAEDLLVAATADGAPREVAAAAAGIHAATFYRWLQRGREVDDLIAKTQERGGEVYEPSDEEHIYLDLLRRIDEAQAKSVVSAVGAMKKLSLGGYVKEETTRRFRDPVTGQIVEETVQKIAEPDVRAASFLLTRGPAKHLFTEPAKGLELTGADGQPIQVQTADEDAVATKVRANLAAARAAITVGATAVEGPSDDGYDGDVVEGEVMG